MKKSNKLPEAWCVEITPEVRKHAMFKTMLEKSGVTGMHSEGFVGSKKEPTFGTTVYESKSFAPEITIDQWCAYTGNLPFDPEKPAEGFFDYEWLDISNDVFIGATIDGRYVFESQTDGYLYETTEVRNTIEFEEGCAVWYAAVSNKQFWSFGSYKSETSALDQNGCLHKHVIHRPIKDAEGNPVYPPFND